MDVLGGNQRREKPNAQQLRLLERVHDQAARRKALSWCRSTRTSACNATRAGSSQRRW
jgi:hypothetical protein